MYEGDGVEGDTLLNSPVVASQSVEDGLSDILFGNITFCPFTSTSVPRRTRHGAMRWLSVPDLTFAEPNKLNA
jgi:hypothetical protein